MTSAPPAATYVGMSVGLACHTEDASEKEVAHRLGFKVPGEFSGVQDLVTVYRQLAQCCDYALHLGLTEAGMGSRGIVASTAALVAPIAMNVALNQGMDPRPLLMASDTPSAGHTVR